MSDSDLNDDDGAALWASLYGSRKQANPSVTPQGSAEPAPQTSGGRYKKPAWQGKDLPSRAKRKPHPLYINHGEFDVIQPGRNLRQADESLAEFTQRQKETKQRLFGVLGTQSAVLPHISEIHVSPQGHTTLVFHNQQQLQLVQNPRTGNVDTTRFLTNQIDQHSVQTMIELQESRGRLVDIDQLRVKKGGQKFKKLLREELVRFQENRQDQVADHFIKLEADLRRQIASSAPGNPNLKVLQQQHRIADSLSTSIVFGVLSNKEVSELFKLTDNGQKTAGAAYGAPDWKRLSQVADKYDGMGAQPDLVKSALRGPARPSGPASP